MKCLNPVDAWFCGYTSAKDGIVSPRLEFSYNRALKYYERIHGAGFVALHYLDSSHTSVDCGRCVNCLMRKRKAMSVRIRHEMSQYEKCCFLTLTYNDENVPHLLCGSVHEKNAVIDRGDLWGELTLLPSDVQKFIKRLRRHLEYKPLKSKSPIRDHVSTPIRYFAVGEYGTKTQRPHYHIIIFGWRPSDLVVHEWRKNYCLYRSAQVEKLWKFGFSTVGECNCGVAKYCAQYVTKKFSRIDSNVPGVCPEFVLSSKGNGGIGSAWLSKYGEYNVPHGYVNVYGSGGVVCQASVPRYYYDRLRKTNKPLWIELRDERIDFIRNNQVQISPDDISASARYALAQLKNEIRKETL